MSGRFAVKAPIGLWDAATSPARFAQLYPSAFVSPATGLPAAGAVITPLPALVYSFQMEGAKDNWLMLFDRTTVPVPGSTPLVTLRALDKISLQFGPPVPIRFAAGIAAAYSTTQHVFSAGAVAATQSLNLFFST